MEGGQLTTAKTEISSQEDTLAIIPVSSPSFIQSVSLASPAQRTPPAALPATPVADGMSNVRTLMPVNIKQILDAWGARTPGCISINSTVTTTVKVIGQVKGRKTDEYKGSFKIEDCTGTIDASIWFTVGRAELDVIPEGAYCMVAGRIRLDGQNPEIQCYACRPVTNFNDITHHHLSVIAVHIDLVQKPAKSVHERVAEMWQEDMIRQGNPKSVGPAPSILFSKPSNKLPGSEEHANGMLSTTDAVLSALRSLAPSNGPTGVHIDAICAELFSDKIATRVALEELADAGEVYTTIDGDHYMQS